MKKFVACALLTLPNLLFASDILIPIHTEDGGSGVSVPPTLPVEVNFAIPGNQYCDANHVTEFSISISNISETDNIPVTLHLYKADGAELLLAGTNNNGIVSDIELASEFVITAGSTMNYHRPISSGSGCSNRVYRGKIESITNGNQLLSSGWISGRNGQNFRSGATIIINGGRSY